MAENHAMSVLEASTEEEERSRSRSSNFRSSCISSTRSFLSRRRRRRRRRPPLSSFPRKVTPPLPPRLPHSSPFPSSSLPQSPPPVTSSLLIRSLFAQTNASHRRSSFCHPPISAAMTEASFKVSLYVYDLSQGLARQLSTSFLGKAIEAIWHTGIVVYGNEYYFGNGIQTSLQGQTHFGKPYKIVELGWTEIPREMFEEYLQEISSRYTAETYSLLHHNCNNFSEEVSQFLLGVGIPDYILKLPQEVMNSPMAALIMPMIQQFETIMRYGGIPQAPGQVSALNQTPNRSTVHANPAQQVLSINRSSVAEDSGISSQGTIYNGTSEASVSADKLGDARARVQNEITSEFAALMANGTLPANEAAALATRKVMGLDHSQPDSVRSESTSSPVKSSDVQMNETDATNVDKLGDARAQVQKEITSEFAALMAQGTLRASEAAALATRKVMERHGRGTGLASQG